MLRSKASSSVAIAGIELGVWCGLGTIIIIILITTIININITITINHYHHQDLFHKQ
jgi:hypothetical protein